tara:strand:+ start:989 stop:1774 length:786 start_codon:yes stop_codon:yes gene_type:complete
MKNNLNGPITILILITSLLVYSCKSVAVLPTKEPVKNADIKLLAKEIDKASTKIKTFRARVKAQYNDGKQKQQVSLNLRMEYNKSLWASASILVPIAKVLITPSRVGFYEKFQKTYYDGDIGYLNDQLGTSFSFKDLENVLLGNTVSEMKTESFDRIEHPQFYVLVPKTNGDHFRPTYFFDPMTFRLKEQRFIIPGSAQSLSVKYLKYQKSQGKTIPKEIEISFFNGSNLIKVRLDFIRVDFPKNLSTPFTIPSGYKKLNI